MLSFAGSKCYTLTKSGSTVTAGGTGVCSATVNGGSAFCLSASVNSNGNLTLTNEGVCGFQDSSTVTFAQPSPGIYSASVTFPPGQNVSQCITCGNNTLTVRENVTLNVQKLCAKEQCEVRSDPPTDTPSPGGQWRPNYCIFGCGDGDGDGGDDDDGDGSDGDDGGGFFAGFPPPFPPPFPPVFPPVFPPGPPGGGSSSSSSSPNGPPGGDPNSPGAAYPITTYLPPGADPPTVQGGTWVPIVNFSQAVPYCGADSNPSRLGSLVLDISVQPSQLYLCQVVANGSYAWMPYCPCQLGASNNRTFYYYNVTTLWRDNSTVLISNTSQLINTGATYLGGPVFIAGPIVFSDAVNMCNAPKVQLPRINGCGGEAPEFPDGITIDGVAVTAGPHTTVLGTTNEVAVAYNAGTNTRTVSLPSEFGPTFTKFSVRTTDLMAITMNDPFTLGAPLFAISDTSILKYLFVYNRTAATVESNFEFVTPKLSATEVVTNNATICPSGSDVTRIKTLGGCNGFPVSMPDGVSIGAPSTVNAAMSINAPLTVTDASYLSITGFPAPLFATSSVTGLYYVPTVYPSLAFCTSYTPMSFSIGLVFNRIGNTKFVFWDWSASFNMPAEITLASSNGCGGATLSTTAGSLTTYNLPTAYRPTTTYSFTVVSTGSGGAVRSTAFAAYVNSAGYLGIVSDNGGTSDLPTGSSSFYMPTLSYV